MGLAMVLLVTEASYSGETVLGRRQTQATRIPVSLSFVITTLYFPEGTVEKAGTLKYSQVLLRLRWILSLRDGSTSETQ